MNKNYPPYYIWRPSQIQLNAPRPRTRTGKARCSFFFSRFSFVRPLLVSMIFLSLIAASCRRTPPASPPKPIAFVGGEPILDSDLNQTIADVGREMPVPQGEALDTLKKELLEEMIQTKAFLQEAKRENVIPSKEEIDEILKRSKAEYSDQEFAGLLKAKGLTYDRWVQKLTENMTIQKLEEKATETVKEPAPEEIKAYYNSHTEDYKLKTGVRIRQILLSTEKEANEVHEALLKGADFAKLALDKSISPDKDLGGDLGILTADQMPEGFEVTLTLPVKAISPVIKTSYGFHIFRVEEKLKERVLPLKEEESKIKNLLLQEKRDKEFAKWAVDLRNRIVIKMLTLKPADSMK